MRARLTNIQRLLLRLGRWVRVCEGVAMLSIAHGSGKSKRKVEE